MNDNQQASSDNGSHSENIWETTSTNNKALYWSMFSAFLVALLIYFTIILPVEFARDPFGTGKLLGLTPLTKEQSLNRGSIEKIDEHNPRVSKLLVEPSARTDTVKILVPAGRGVEYKFEMNKHARLTYKWFTDNSILYYDFHGEPQGDTTGFFESFAISNASSAEGTATVPFTGVHGWYWKNNSDSDIQVTLETKGSYHIKGLLQ